MDRTDTSIAKLQKYEMVADKLIDGKLDGKIAIMQFKIFENFFFTNRIMFKTMIVRNLKKNTE